MSTETTVSLLLAAGFVALLGVLIKYFGMVELVAGYDPDSVTDEKGLANFVGTNALYVAGLTAIVAVAEYAQPFEGYQLLWFPYFFGVGLLTVRMVRGARRYER